MKIFQGVTEIAGQMGILAKEFEKKGLETTCYNTFHSYLGYEDHLINLEKQQLEEHIETILSSYDVYHYHYAKTLHEQYEDLERLKGKKKKAVMHHWGNDVRFHEQARMRNRYVYTGDSPSNEVMEERLKRISSVIKDAIVQDYEVFDYVAPYYERVHVVPIGIDLSRTPYKPKTANKVPLLLHAPTNREFKGTAYFERALDELAKDYTFNYVKVEKMGHDEALALYEQADIILDQVLCGSYGLLSVEAMALGKPVVTYIRDDLVPRFPAIPPVVNSHPTELVSKIAMLLENRETRLAYGEKGRHYVETYHCSTVIAPKLLQIYEDLPYI